MVKRNFGRDERIKFVLWNSIDSKIKILTNQKKLLEVFWQPNKLNNKSNFSIQEEGSSFLFC